MRVEPIACLSDNYAYLLVDPETNAAAIVDPSEPDPVLRATALRGGLEVVAILATHHHHDHVGGVKEVKERLGIPRVYGHESDKGRIPEQTELLRDGSSFPLGSLRVDVLHIPGHTLGAVAYVVTGGPDDAAVFTGDTLFVGGCGRIFEGDPAMMHASLQKLARLPAHTRIYCGHEYTESNLRFAASKEPTNEDVREAQAAARQRRAAGAPTVPSTVAAELTYNPFLRVRSKELRDGLAIAAGASDEEALGAVRRAKDAFK
jgi:hydroxyacylglutathione hydrolase